MKAMVDKKPKPLAQMMKAWKQPNKPQSHPQAKMKSTTVPPRRNRGLLRFSEAFAENKPLHEAKAYDAELAGTSLMVIDKDRTKAELKELIEGFATDCMHMSNDGHTVMAVAVAYD